MKTTLIILGDIIYAPYGIIKKAIASMDLEYRDETRTAWGITAVWFVMLILFIVFMGCSQPQQSSREIWLKTDTVRFLFNDTDIMRLPLDTNWQRYKLRIVRRPTTDRTYSIFYFSRSPQSHGSGEIPQQIGHTP